MDSQSQRQRWLSVLAQADAGALETACAPLAELMSKPWQWLRQPETGLVMVRGRIGGTGAKFNLGEVPVTRCALRLEQINGIGAVGGRRVDEAPVPTAVVAYCEPAIGADVDVGGGF